MDKSLTTNISISVRVRCDFIVRRVDSHYQTKFMHICYFKMNVSRKTTASTFHNSNIQQMAQQNAVL